MVPMALTAGPAVATPCGEYVLLLHFQQDAKDGVVPMVVRSSGAAGTCR